MASASSQDGGTIEVMAPRDAKGRLVPLDVKVMYSESGIEYEVDTLLFERGTDTHDAGWTVRGCDHSSTMVYSFPLDSMYLEKPDSLKQLMRDLNRVQDAHDERGKKYYETPVDYIQCQGKRCDDCRLHDHEMGETCFEAMMDDIVSRVNRLYIDSNRLAGDAE